MRSKLYYRNIKLIRIISAIAILFYHLGIIKGGYLAVCTFFVLSGYLACYSAFNKDNFSLISYYKNRFKKVYAPLIVVTFVAIATISFFNNIYWFNLKPETTSVLFGYNNFWQRSVNLDYFARHIDSPFMHLWYISILIQFELIFPFLFKILKKIGDKFRSIPCIFLFSLFVLSSFYFYKINLTKGINYAYYDTFARSFSFFLGMFIGFLNHYYKILVFNNKIFRNIIFIFYLTILIILFIFIPSSNSYYSIFMILATIISARMIEYGSLNVSSKSYLPDITYEMYLIQYPIIFLFEYINISSKTFIILLLVLSLSILLHYVLYGKKFKYLKILLSLLVICFSFYGFYKYSIAKDYTKEMNDLKEQLANNEKNLIENNKKYLDNLKKEEEDWQTELKNFNNYEEKLKEIVKQLPIVGIGDSVMLGAVNNLYNIFPNGYFDAKISRTAWSAAEIFENLKNNNKLGYPIIIHLGTNGDCSTSCKDEIMSILGNRIVYFINTTNLDYVNNNLSKYVSEHENVYLIDWKTISSGHREYFYADGIHLTPTGRNAYANAIYNAIYNNYLNEYKIKKDNMIKEHEDKKNNKITFYGNEILLNAFGYIKKDFSDSNFIIDDYEKIINILKEGNLTKKLVFVFNNLSIDDYNNLMNLSKDNIIYIFNINGNINRENVYNIDIKNEYLMPDGIHLNENGNNELARIIKENIEK